jgi:putative transposase
MTDGRSVKAPAANKYSYDPGKSITGRKRRIAVDTDGSMLTVNLTTANSAGAQLIVHAIRSWCPGIKRASPPATSNASKRPKP